VEALKGLALTDVSCGFDHTLVIDPKGFVLAFGANHYHQVSPSTVEAIYTPQMVPLEEICVSVLAGHKYSVAITSTTTKLTKTYSIVLPDIVARAPRGF